MRRIRAGRLSRGRPWVDDQRIFRTLGGDVAAGHPSVSPWPGTRPGTALTTAAALPLVAHWVAPCIETTCGGSPSMTPEECDDCIG